MGELCKRTEEWRVADEAEAKALIEKAKAERDDWKARKEQCG